MAEAIGIQTVERLNAEQRQKHLDEVNKKLFLEEVNREIPIPEPIYTLEEISQAWTRMMLKSSTKKLNEDAKTAEIAGKASDTPELNQWETDGGGAFTANIHPGSGTINLDQADITIDGNSDDVLVVDKLGPKWKGLDTGIKNGCIYYWNAGAPIGFSETTVTTNSTNGMVLMEDEEDDGCLFDEEQMTALLHVEELYGQKRVQTNRDKVEEYIDGMQFMRKVSYDPALTHEDKELYHRVDIALVFLLEVASRLDYQQQLQQLEDDENIVINVVAS